MPKYKAAAYIRLSYTDDHSSESDSVSNQRKLIENFVERNPDIEVVSEKIDDGYSGIIFDRPAFKEQFSDCPRKARYETGRSSLRETGRRSPAYRRGRQGRSAAPATPRGESRTDRG